MKIAQTLIDPQLYVGQSFFGVQRPSRKYRDAKKSIRYICSCKEVWRMSRAFRSKFLIPIVFNNVSLFSFFHSINHCFLDINMHISFTLPNTVSLSFHVCVSCIQLRTKLSGQEIDMN